MPGVSITITGTLDDGNIRAFTGLFIEDNGKRATPWRWRVTMR